VGGGYVFYAIYTEAGGVLPEDQIADSDLGGWGNATLNDIVLIGQLNKQIQPATEIGSIAVDLLSTGLELTWTTGYGHDYQLQIKTNLTDVGWASNSTHTAAGESMTVTTAVDQAHSFYRVIVE